MTSFPPDSFPFFLAEGVGHPSRADAEDWTNYEIFQWTTELKIGDLLVTVRDYRAEAEQSESAAILFHDGTDDGGRSYRAARQRAEEYRQAANMIERSLV